jgi:hypothetical protein
MNKISQRIIKGIQYPGEINRYRKRIIQLNTSGQLPVRKNYNLD